MINMSIYVEPSSGHMGGADPAQPLKSSNSGRSQTPTPWDACLEHIMCMSGCGKQKGGPSAQGLRG